MRVLQNADCHASVSGAYCLSAIADGRGTVEVAPRRGAAIANTYATTPHFRHARSSHSTHAGSGFSQDCSAWRKKDAKHSRMAL